MGSLYMIPEETGKVLCYLSINRWRLNAIKTLLEFGSINIPQVKHCFIVEIKSEGEYFMTSIKGQYFRRIMEVMLEVLSFFDVIKYEPEEFISIIKTSIF